MADMSATSAVAVADFPWLRQLFGANFHQDWAEDDDDAQHVVREYLRGFPADYLSTIIEEIDRVLSLHLDEPTLAKVITFGFGSSYGPEPSEKSYTAWLEEIRSEAGGEMEGRGRTGVGPA